MSEIKKEKRDFFSQIDAQMLVNCIKKRSKILDSKKTNEVTPDIKAKVIYQN